MTPIDDGGPAFPKAASPTVSAGNSQIGMSLRDYFASQALTGLLAYSHAGANGTFHDNCTYFGVADVAYAYADAMLQSRKGK